MLGGGGRVRNEQHLDAERADLSGDGAHDEVALLCGYVADVDGGYTSGVLADDRAVNLRVLLAGVADEDERQARVGGEEGAYDAELVLLVPLEGRRAPVLLKSTLPCGAFMALPPGRGGRARAQAAALKKASPPQKAPMSRSMRAMIAARVSSVREA